MEKKTNIKELRVLSEEIINREIDSAEMERFKKENLDD